ncbi:enoyl-CoA hydratase [Kyrpidia spormannii]|uniref:Enoyl-CoA hydratase n=2 Tax=Kyrpidia spormannii TaxID=2055160 RepID=A0ACA8Z6G0_9BACL|nr:MULTISPECIES: enoyl-CoA hydratase [Kyrpidia]ATY84246.1 enoyl-CoA hydratase [Kyrpidia spormannii]MCL6576436.1 enoyl-CoA hydratase [Kyrpidia sp.]CAB3390706.1 Enoyl-CoA hydratase [Kyrpidia spormannii]HHY66109.1 enoyl-CoA hydratase [Alicyclobacillus sp.]
MGYITYRESGKKAYVTLNNDRQRNALSRAVLEEFNQVLGEIRPRRDLNVVIIQAEGKVFSSGHNLREIGGQPSDEVLELFNVCQTFMLGLQRLPQVTLAKVHGVATAAGCQLVAACDLAVASRDAKFATPGVNIGLFCSTPAVFVSRNVGRKKAAEMLFTGDFISAEEALLHGLVNRVVPPEELDAAVEELADRVARHSLSTLEIGKRMFYKQLSMDDASALEYASGVITLNSAHPDAVEGIRAFFEKRPPSWRAEEGVKQS